MGRRDTGIWATCLLLLAGSTLLLCGCSPGVPETRQRESPSTSVATEDSIELVAVTVEKFRRQLATLRGEIVVTDMWATWCIPCIERFPHMVELYHRYKDDGVTFVSVCLDDPGDELAVEHARRFLAEQQAVFANYLIDENTADAFEKLDLLSIPAVFIYGADGELRHRLTADDPNDQFTEEDVEEAIRSLLAERPAA